MPHSRLLAGLALAATFAAGAASGAPIYKCFDRSLGVLYTDEPCKGEVLDIQPGSSDPVALAELQRERAALSRSAAQRVAASLAPAAPPVVNYAAPPDGAPPFYADYGNALSGYGYGFAPHAERPRDDRDDRGGRGRDAGRMTIRTVPATPPQLPHR